MGLAENRSGDKMAKEIAGVGARGMEVGVRLESISFKHHVLGQMFC